jgi:hypothetical protein
LSSLPLASDLASALHVTALTSLKAFKSVSMHKNNCFENALGMMMVVRNLRWVTGQGRYTLTRVCVPELDRIVFASTGYCPVGPPCHRVDPAFAMRWVSTLKQLRPGKKIGEKKKILRIWVPAQRALRSVRLKKKFTDRFF